MSHGRHALKPGIDAIKVIADSINQPLFAITANTEAIARILAREAPDLREVGAALADITSDAQRVSRMVGTVQRLLVATQEPAADIDVRELVDECMVEMRTEMFAQRVSCDVQTAPHLPGIHGIRRQLVQMLVNLVTNSLEAMSGMPAANGASRCVRCCTIRAPSRFPWRIPAWASRPKTHGASSIPSSPPSRSPAAWASPSAATSSTPMAGTSRGAGSELRRRLQGHPPGQ